MRGSPTALLFPGALLSPERPPGPVDPLQAVWDREPQLAELAVREVGADPFKRVHQGTRYLHPALYCASVTSWISLGQPTAEYTAGYSVGEFAALAAAEFFDVEEGLRLVVARARMIAEAKDQGPELGALWISGLSSLDVRWLCKRHHLSFRVDDCPGQLVLTGEAVALAAAGAEARERGGRALRADSSELVCESSLESLRVEFSKTLAETKIHPPKRIAYCSTSARPFDDVRVGLLDTLTKPLAWRRTLLALHAAGARRFVDVGPGSELASLASKTLPGAHVETGHRAYAPVSEAPKSA